MGFEGSFVRVVGLLADLRSLVLDMRSLDVQNNNIRCPETGVPTPAQSTWGAKHRLTHPAGVRSSGVSTSLYFRSLPGSQRNFPRLRVLRGDSPALALSLGTRVQTSPGGEKTARSHPWSETGGETFVDVVFARPVACPPSQTRPCKT